MFGLFGSSSTDERRIAELERKVDAIIQHLGIELPTQPADDPSFRAKIQATSRTQGKIAAVAEYREVTKCTLLEAKQAVEDIMRR